MSNDEFNQRLTIILTDLVAHYDLASSNYNNNNDNLFFTVLPV